jgi:cbb3-type cytochrome oxidase maturation protein
MTVLLLLVPLALLLGLLGLAAFLWALRSGQYDDLDGAALRVLSDDDLAP